MSYRAYSKTTFGIANKDWIVIIALVKIILSLLVIICAVIEISFVVYSNYKNIDRSEFDSPSSCRVVSHYLLYLTFQFIIGAALFSEISSKIWIRILLISTSLSCLYNYNPWIIFHQSNVHNIYVGLKYTFLFQPILVPFMILTSLFALWIHWKMRKTEKDYEPFEVIYGGEDSATKILIDKYE
ncbi:unnamed protein product [Caenorhabditis brenneri]